MSHRLGEDDSGIVHKYLTHFCEENNGSLADYAKDFKSDYLQDIEKKIKIMLSKDGMTGLGDGVDIKDFK